MILLVILLTLIACSELTFPKMPEPGAGADSLLIVVHGGGDSAAGWPAGFVTRAEAGLKEPDRWDIWAYDWAKDAEGGVNVTRRGERHGEWLGEQLAASPYTHVHLVGHSAGAFVLYGATATLGPDSAMTVHETFFDPFGGLGLVRWGYGERRFGETSDFAEAYVNTEDGVPSTDDPFPGMVSFDLSSFADDDLEAKPGHRFPIGWYEARIGQDIDVGWALSAEWTGVAPTHEALGLARGTVEIPG